MILPVNILFLILLGNGTVQFSQTSKIPLVSAGEKTQIVHLQIASQILGDERNIYLALPPNYDRNVHHYPVIFVLDGEFLFDISRSIVTLRATRNYMPESIVVGLPNPNRKARFQMAMKLTSPSGQLYYQGGGDPEAYIRFMRDELIPALAESYRINAHRTIMGLSPTTGVVYHAFLKHPELFKAYIAMNSGINSRMQDGQSIGDHLLAVGAHRDGQYLYLSHPPHPRAEVLKNQRSDLALFMGMMAKKASPAFKVLYEIQEGESGYGAVIPSISDAMDLIYPPEKWRPNYGTFRNSEKPHITLKTYYDQLSKEYGFPIYPTEDTFSTANNLLFSAELLNRRNRHAQVIELLKLGLTYFPNSPKIHLRLAQAYAAVNQKALAIEMGDIALAKAKQFSDPLLPIYQKQLDELRIQKQ